ncbi:hypothetical protein [Streptomyces syringium]|uniref:hypothetical protein n=1 Tax=Streptomyces syringium TaxID=76729 RepID=UPI0034294443
MPELISLAVMLVLSSMDAVRNQASNMVYEQFTHPEQLVRLRTERALPQAVEASPTSPPTATRRSSATRSASTSPTTPPATCPSATARTTASAP